MNAARLEELAAWAETEANALDCKGSEKASGRLRALARCARVVAKADRLKREYEHFKRREGLGAFLGIGIRGWADQKSFLHVVEDAHDPSPHALEAVEAAEAESGIK